MNREFKVRFNLSRGANFMKWKVEYNGHVEYLDPEHTQLVMYNCKLHNNKSTAQKIFAGENKSVCAWIRCAGLCVLYDHLFVGQNDNHKLSYNPKRKPYWCCDNNDVDGNTYKSIHSNGRELYVD